MLERHVEERPHGGVEGGRIEPRQRQPRRLHRLAIPGEGVRRAAVHVARELVAQKDQRQRSVGRLPPVIQAALDRPFEGRREALADLGVELGRTGPPDVARLAMLGMVERQEPEIEDIADGWRGSHDLTVAWLLLPVIKRLALTEGNRYVTISWLIELRDYLDSAGRRPLRRWLDELDAMTRARVTKALVQLSLGNLSDANEVQDDPQP